MVLLFLDWCWFAMILSLFWMFTRPYVTLYTMESLVFLRQCSRGGQYSLICVNECLMITGVCKHKPVLHCHVVGMGRHSTCTPRWGWCPPTYHSVYIARSTRTSTRNFWEKYEDEMTTNQLLWTASHIVGLSPSERAGDDNCEDK